MYKVNSNMYKVQRAFVASFALGMACAVSAADLAIPQVPLQTGSDVPANILFLLDDSLSMSLEHMPDAISYGWQLSNQGVSGGSKTSTAVNVRYKWYYSSKVNTIYYDPNVTYTIPPGVSYTNPTYTSARIDGFLSSSLSRNLSNNFVLEFDQWNSNFNGYQYTGNVKFTDGGFYYNYNPSAADKASCDSDPMQNKCYVYVSMNAASTADKTNFAIWYSYYRSRILLSRSAIGTAFNTLPESVRIGHGKINGTVVTQGVREFTGSARTAFLSWLYSRYVSQLATWTPLRGALDSAGKYYSTDAPYRIDPSDSTSPIISCRQNFTILMTDGFWNQDGTINFPDVDKDGNSNTLADVARHYYLTDLRTGTEFPNNVPRRKQSSPSWQHMVTFGVGLGVDGTEDPEVLKKYTPDDSEWLNPVQGTLLEQIKRKIDDLVHASVNADGDFFSAKDPKTFQEKMVDALRGILNRVASASNLSATTTSLQEDNSVFQASFDTASWSGDLVSRDVDDLTTVEWRANFPAWGDRKLIASRGNTANPTTFAFSWANLTAAEKLVLKDEKTVKFLAGNRSDEKPLGTLRNRTSLLGDIAHSSPVYVAAPLNRNYQRNNQWPESGSYSAFVAANKNRPAMVYVGANDGMLHAFNANNSSVDKGKEVFAYIPQKMLKTEAKWATFAEADYEHRFFVDGSATVHDVYFSGSWRTVLVTTLGRGGNSMFALDITNPTAVKVLWDIELPELGIMTSKPVITRLNNGRWSVLTGYGYNNSVSKAGMLIVDVEKGASSPVVKIETNASSADGLGQLEGVDISRNGNIDWVFAGDLKGNVWKFDLSSTSSDSWGLAYSGNPLFVAKSKVGDRQPITGGVSLETHPETGQLWVFFGTGKFLESGDSVSNDSQSWYGLADGSVISSRSELVDRTMVNEVYTNQATGESREARRVPIAAPNDMNAKRGWVMDLIDSRERITSRPRIIGNNLVINTIIPDSDLCNPQGDGWIMAVDPFAGSRLGYHFFDLSRDEKFTETDGLSDKEPASGVKFEGMPGEPVFVGDEMFVGDSRVAIDKGRVNLQIRRGRLSWREVVNQ